MGKPEVKDTAPDRLKATLALEEPVTRVAQVSAARGKALARLGIRTVRDLVTHFPRRYLDLSRVETVGGARIGDTCTIEGVIHDIKLKRPKPRLSLVEISLVDNTGVLIVTMFRQPWLMDRLEKGDRIAVAGKVEFNYGFKRMTGPFLEKLEDASAEGMIVPFHPSGEKITPAIMRLLAGNALDLVCGMYDPLPLVLRERYRLMSRYTALSCIHFPQDMEESAQARRRLAYEELLLLQLHMMMEGAARSAGRRATAHLVDGPKTDVLKQALPFTLTEEQDKALQEIFHVMAAPTAANHLLLGDVGTGKTAVAAFAMAAAVQSGGQAMMLAPTEVLATQHFEKLAPLFEAAGITCALLTGSTSPDARADMVDRFASGTLDILIGTHALLEPDVVAHNLTLAVIDEQQRFGVDQRAALLEKGEAPDALFLTATPIPRSLALALYGNLTLSYIKTKPLSGAPRTTVVLPKTRQGEAFEAARAALARGEQVYVVCPLIGKAAKDDEDETQMRDESIEYYSVSIDSDDDLRADNLTAATQEAKFLQTKVFPDTEVALLHGGMSSAEKADVMERFRAGEVGVLVATTVIEVGVDVPSATVMIVEDADRFGLSQLHQLRGRVGRGTAPGEVYLISSSKREGALARLAAMEATEDGFELASYDLELRREGDILGNRQSGASVLKLVNVVRDSAMVEAAHADARSLLESDPDLSEPDHRALAREVRLIFGSGNATVGG